MGQTLVRNFIHIVFSTKNRVPFIDREIEKELYAYIGGICKNSDCTPIRVGGHKDHIHILCILSKKVALMNLMEEIKSHSSKWIKSKGDKYRNFYWQNGYGAFSVNPAEIDRVIAYIENQHQHHHIRDFKTEFTAILVENSVEFDSRYVWD